MKCDVRIKISQHISFHHNFFGDGKELKRHIKYFGCRKKYSTSRKLNRNIFVTNEGGWFLRSFQSWRSQMWFSTFQMMSKYVYEWFQCKQADICKWIHHTGLLVVCQILNMMTAKVKNFLSKFIYIKIRLHITTLNFTRRKKSMSLDWAKKVKFGAH